MQFNVFGKNIKVKKVKNLCINKQALATYSHTTKSIEVDTTLRGKELIHTYMHELIHATVDRLGLHNTQLSHDLEEVLADNIPEMILENFNVTIKCKKKKAE
jgi:hypothetical protein